MRIQHNIAALNSYRQLTGNNNALSKNLEKLSSGYRINRAGDDAAGLAISEKMRAQIKGLEVAQKNANDGISLVQTAEGALTEVHSMLNRMVELATQSANGTYDNETSRANLQKEIKSLLDEVDRISESTNFNSINLLDGSIGDAKGIEFGAADVVDGTALTNPATVAKVENGELTAGKEAVAAESYFYMPDKIQVSYDANGGAAGTTTIAFDVDDGAGGTNTITLTATGDNTAGSVKEFTMEDVAKALNGETVTGLTVAITGTGALGTAAKVNDAYEFSFENNKLVVTATEAGAGWGVNGNVTVAGTGGAAGDGAEDIAEMTKILKEDYASNTNASATDTTGANGPIGLGAETMESIKGEDAVDGSYKVASAELSITAANGAGFKIGDKTYVFQAEGSELPEGIDPSKVTVVKYDPAKATDYTSNSNALNALANKINETSGDTGIQAKVTGGKVILSETEAYGKKEVYDKGSLANSIKFGDIVGDSDIKVGGSGANKEITITDELTDGMQVSVNGKTYEFVKDGGEATKGKIAVDFKEGDAAANAQALLDAIKANDTDLASKVTLTGETINLGSETVATDANSKGLTLQVGDTADSFQKVNVVVKSTSAKSLGIDGIDISTQEGASAAIDKIKAAINQVSSTRGDLGATQNRLEHTINNLGVTTENLTAAESRIRDTDMAEEMMNYTKNNILVQAAQAMLAQANTVPQGVLQLLQ